MATSTKVDPPIVRRLRNNVKIGDIFVFDRDFPGSLVCVSVRIRPDLIDRFAAETGGELRDPPTLSLN